MTLDEMERTALDAIERQKEMAARHPGLFDRPTSLSLVLKRPEPRGDKVRLVGRSGPLGEFLSSPGDNEVLALFKAEEILAWVKKQKAAKERAARG